MTATFARSGVAYKQDGSQVATGVPRYETGKYGQAIMVEEGTTNLILRSQEFDTTATWYHFGSVTVGANAAVAPDGTSTADQLTVTGAGHLLAQLIPVSASTTYRVSWWAKQNGSVTPKYSVYDQTGAANIIGATSYTLTGSWVRQSVTFTTPAGCAEVAIYILRDSGAGVDIFVWGAQLEQKSYATSYMATTSATVTRNAEILTIPTSGVLSDSAGTIEGWFYESGIVRAGFILINAAGSQYVYSDGTNYIIGFGAGASFAKPSVGWHHIAFTWAAGSLKTYLDGVLKTTVTASPSWGSTLYVGLDNASARQWNGLIDDLRIYNTAHSAATILADYTAGPWVGGLVVTTAFYRFDSDLASLTSGIGNAVSSTSRIGNAVSSILP